jgi:hypothetical protein
MASSKTEINTSTLNCAAFYFFCRRWHRRLWARSDVLPRAFWFESCKICNRFGRQGRTLNLLAVAHAGAAGRPHRKLRHPRFAGAVIVSGQDGDDAKDYQEKQVRNAVREASR